MTDTKDTQEPGADMLMHLERIALGHVDATPQQVRAAVEVLRYRLGDPPTGKKEAQKRAAENLMQSKFAPMKPPARFAK